MGTLLTTTGLSVAFGGVRAVDDVSIEVGEGQLAGLIGPNGAGKTTTIDAITGFVPHRGRIMLGDRDLSRQPAHQRARAGLARTWQSLELFDDLTVYDNCRVAAERVSAGRSLREVFVPDGRVHLPDVDWALDLLDLGELAYRSPSSLSLGQRKVAAVARALSARPKVVLLDEPAAGLDSDESLLLGSRIRRMVDSGISVLLIDHDMGLVLSVCDVIFVLEFGRVIAHGDPAAIRRDERVIEAYLGESASSAGIDAGAAG